MKKILAHFSKSTCEWETLLQHNSTIKEIIRPIIDKIGGFEHVDFMVDWHDAGKINPAWQDYFKASVTAEMKCESFNGSSVPHAVIGALKTQANTILSNIIWGHHAGLLNAREVVGRIDKLLLERFPPNHGPTVISLSDYYLGYENYSVPVLHWNKTFKRQNGAALYLRMLFSAMVDADRIATESFCDTDKYEHRKSLNISYDQLVSEFQKTPVPSHSDRNESEHQLNELREKIRIECETKTLQKGEIYSLTLPAGMGKTNDALTLAFGPSANKNFSRVIFATPYTIITTQVADVLRKIFPPEAVLEHHTGFHMDESETETNKNKILTANWASPLISTTHVQLFESLYSRKASKLRKLHNLVDSLIIIDEFHTLPQHFLEPICLALKLLSENYGCTILFCTATPMDWPVLGLEVTDLVSMTEEELDTIRRVKYSHIGTVTHQDIAQVMKKEAQALCIVNTKIDAFEIYRHIHDCSHVMYYSGQMCPLHRKHVLKEIKRKLTQNIPCVLISTQAMECGIDISFPVVYRDEAPVYAISQGAGRSNRHMELGRLGGKCVVFDLKDRRYPSATYQTDMAISRKYIDHDLKDIDTIKIQKAFFKDKLTAGFSTTRNVNVKDKDDPTKTVSCPVTHLDSEGVISFEKNLDIRYSSQVFNLIDDETLNLFVRYTGENGDSDKCSRLLERVKIEGQIDWLLWKELQQYCVKIFVDDKNLGVKDGRVVELIPDFFVWEADYNPVFGIPPIRSKDLINKFSPEE